LSKPIKPKNVLHESFSHACCPGLLLQKHMKYMPGALSRIPAGTLVPFGSRNWNTCRSDKSKNMFWEYVLYLCYFLYLFIVFCIFKYVFLYLLYAFGTLRKSFKKSYVWFQSLNMSQKSMKKTC